jgi:hypothetical protein
MTERSKKIVATAFATLIGLAALAVQMEIVPASQAKVALFLVAGLSMVNTFFLPAVLGEVVAPPLDPPRTPPSATALVLFIVASLLVPGCACWRPSSERYASPECMLARGVVDCAAEVASGAAGKLATRIREIDGGADPAEAKRAALRDLKAASGTAFACALAGVQAAAQGVRFAAATPPASRKFLAERYRGTVFVGLDGGAHTVVR